MDVLRHLLGSGITASHFDFQRVMQQLFRQRLDVVREGRGEQQILAFRRELRQHAANIMNKAHIQHTVGFIKHQDFNLVQADGILMFKIQQAPRGGHQNIDAAAQLHHLRVNTHPAKNHQRANIQVFAVIANVFTDLCRQFTRWREDQRAHRATAFSMRLFLNQMLQERQGKARRFAGAGLGAGHQIASLQHRRDSLLLNWGWLKVTLLGDSAQDIRVQAKGIKRHNNSKPPRPVTGVVFGEIIANRDGKNHNAIKGRSLAGFVTQRINIPSGPLRRIILVTRRLQRVMRNTQKRVSTILDSDANWSYS